MDEDIQIVDITEEFSLEKFLTVGKTIRTQGFFEVRHALGYPSKIVEVTHSKSDGNKCMPRILFPQNTSSSNQNDGECVATTDKNDPFALASANDNNNDDEVMALDDNNCDYYDPPSPPSATNIPATQPDSINDDVMNMSNSYVFSDNHPVIAEENISIVTEDVMNVKKGNVVFNDRETNVEENIVVKNNNVVLVNQPIIFENNNGIVTKELKNKNDHNVVFDDKPLDEPTSFSTTCHDEQCPVDIQESSGLPIITEVVSCSNTFFKAQDHNELRPEAYTFFKKNKSIFNFKPKDTRKMAFHLIKMFQKK